MRLFFELVAMKIAGVGGGTTENQKGQLDKFFSLPWREIKKKCLYSQSGCAQVYINVRLFYFPPKKKRSVKPNGACKQRNGTVAAAVKAKEEEGDRHTKPRIWLCSPGSSERGRRGGGNLGVTPKYRLPPNFPPPPPPLLFPFNLSFGWSDVKAIMIPFITQIPSRLPSPEKLVRLPLCIFVCMRESNSFPFSIFSLDGSLDQLCHRSLGRERNSFFFLICGIASN